MSVSTMQQSMIAAVVRFPLPDGTTREAARDLFESTTRAYQKIPGLIRKYFLFGEGPVGGGVYLWANRGAAEQFHTSEWRERLTERFGESPDLMLFDSPVIIDNFSNLVVVQ